MLVNGKRILRVFPIRTSYTPTDAYAFIGEPGLFIPEHDEIHISCTFTWDKEYSRYLQKAWQHVTEKPVQLGGVAFGSKSEEFVQGLYVKPNILFTSRGCNNNCSFCVVPKNEGKLRYLPISEGNIIQDNNFLQCSKEHKNKVFEMLKKQKGICFKGGLESSLIDNDFIENITSLRIKELWLACDCDSEVVKTIVAIEKLKKAGFTNHHIKCYCLIGDDMSKNEERLRHVYMAGAMPFAQLYRDYSEQKTEYTKDWMQFARKWQRPAATIAHMSEKREKHENVFLF